MKRVLIVVLDESARFPHRSPGLRLARALEESDSWAVDVWDEATEPRRNGVVAAVRRLADPERRPDRKPVVVLFGDTASQRHAVWEIVKAGLRPRISLVLPLQVGEVPMPRAAGELLALADGVLVESQFGARAVRACLREAQALREPRIAVLPPSPETVLSPRSADRADALDAPFRVGCVLEPYSERNAFLALSIFRAFADGHYSICEGCAFVTPWGERSENFEPVPSVLCMRCGSDRGRRGRTWRATLRLVAFPTPCLEQVSQSTWDLATLRGVLGLSGRVSVEGEDGVPILDTESAWLDCLASFDAHLSVHSSAAVDRSALMTCALGVPTIATRFGASSELLDGRAWLVEPRDALLDPAGHWTPVMDVGRAAATLAELAAAREARRSRFEDVGSGGGCLSQRAAERP